MRLYKTIDGDLELINSIKNGENHGWIITKETDFYCDIKENR